ncbi:MAG TPA: barstar family protein [Luteimonas sp.]
MTGIELGALLADASQAAAYFIDVRDRAAVVEAATGLDFHIATANLETVDDADALLDEIATALELPPSSNDDLEVLGRSLADLSWLPAEGYLLLIDHCSDIRDAEPDAFAGLLASIDDAARVHAARGVPFWAVLPVATPPA